MEPRISLITLGVADVARSRRFYEALGWRASSASQEGVAFFQAGGMALALFGREALAEDAGLADAGSGFGGIALAQNMRTQEAVDQLMAEAERAGARIVKPAQKVFWGGYSGYFADPDGHLWEIAWNPGFALDADGSLRLPA
ncbi:MAG: VOC family protein [Parvibaculum sp.]|uniref:VOC family protein n=1 Tax=Parvibaculum sp. TaxID=2024848 RepID=UPI00284AF0CE|nr:VOC family protein [Parvibaculum sp.]MDR3500098.1 VOC family protein [Parvibaculum sp.]